MNLFIKPDEQNGVLVVEDDNLSSPTTPTGEGLENND